MKDELGGKIMTQFVGFRPKAYYYLIDDGSEDRRAKETKKKCVVKGIFQFTNFKNCLLNNEIILESKKKKDLKVKHIMYISKKLTR